MKTFMAILILIFGLIFYSCDVVLMVKKQRNDQTKYDDLDQEKIVRFFRGLRIAMDLFLIPILILCLLQNLHIIHC